MARYEPVIERVINDIVRKDIQGRYIVPEGTTDERIIAFYQERVQYYVTGRSFIDPSDVPKYGELINSTKLNNLQKNIEYDLIAHYAEAENVANYYNFQKRSVETLIHDSIKFLNNASNRLRGFREIKAREVYFTDTVHNTFQYNDNNTDATFTLDIDSDIENIKLLPYKRINHSIENVSYITAYPLSNGLSVYETVTTKKIYANDITDPYYMILIGKEPYGKGDIFGGDVSGYDGAVVGIKMAFKDIKAANRLRVSTFSSDLVEIIGLYYNETPDRDFSYHSWKKVDIKQTNEQDNPFFMELLFERVYGIEFCLVLGQKSYINMDEVYFEEDMMHYDYRLIVKELKKASYRSYGYRDINYLDTKRDPLKDAAHEIKMRLDGKDRKTKEGRDLKEYIIGLIRLELEDVDYINHGFYRSDTMVADGNIYNIAFESQESNYVDDEEPERKIGTATNYGIIIDDTLFPVADTDGDERVVDIVMARRNTGTYALNPAEFGVDVGNPTEVTTFNTDFSKYIVTRFLVDEFDPDNAKIHYNGNVFAATDVKLYPNPLGYYYLDKDNHDACLIGIEDPDNLIFPDSIVAVRYKVPEIAPDGSVYDTANIDTLKSIGYPNLIDKQAYGTRCDFFYVRYRQISGTGPMDPSDDINDFPDYFMVHRSFAKIVELEIHEDGVKSTYRFLEIPKENLVVEDYASPDFFEYYKIPSDHPIYEEMMKVMFFDSGDPSVDPYGGVPYIYFDLDYVLHPVDGYYYGVVKTKLTETRNIVGFPDTELVVSIVDDSGDAVVTIYDEYHKGTLLVYVGEQLLYNIIEYDDDDPSGSISDKRVFRIPNSQLVKYNIYSPGPLFDDTIEAIIKVSYKPLNPKSYWATSNIRDYNETDYFDNTKNVVLTKYPFVDHIIVLDTEGWNYKNGTFIYKDRYSVQYEPFSVFVGEDKAINMTDYRTEGINVNEAIGRYDHRYEVKGKELIFNNKVDQTVTVRYHTLASSMAVDLLAARIDNKRNDITPMVESNNIMVDIRK